MARRDQLDTLKAFRKASLFLVGDADMRSPPAEVSAMADITKGSQYVEIANTGHLPPIESPKATTAALKNFLKRTH
jgi:3-oxoadipate enol-lactonase